jgi:hypothetical protein
LDWRQMKWREAGKKCIMGCFTICTLSCIIRMIKTRSMRWAGQVAQIGEKRKETTRKTKMWVDNIKIDRCEIWRVDMDWIDLAQAQWTTIVNMIMNFQVS